MIGRDYTLIQCVSTKCQDHKEAQEPKMNPNRNLGWNVIRKVEMIRKGRFMLWYDSMCIKENKSIFMVVCFSIPQPQKTKAISLISGRGFYYFGILPFCVSVHICMWVWFIKIWILRDLLSRLNERRPPKKVYSLFVDFVQSIWQSFFW